ncbi:hypothetical protein T07_2312 [Trichinella nelsoni]|uniref:Uncharacterized protein n=1 Tax=Trichinella nelsoni TaxID=6336 RepID=A0A0V0RN45_9BILA|nr:hypothetical protein T07_2312 [Trichinella nelsoni]
MIAYIRKNLTFYYYYLHMTMLSRSFTSSKPKRIGVSRFDERSINLNLARFVRALIEYSASNSNQLRLFETGQFLIKQTQTVFKKIAESSGDGRLTVENRSGQFVQIRSGIENRVPSKLYL